MRKAIINISLRAASKWSAERLRLLEAYNCDSEPNAIIDLPPRTTPPDCDTNTAWGIVNETIEFINKVFADGTPIAAVIVNDPDPVINHRIVKSCPFPTIFVDQDYKGLTPKTIIREY